MKVLSLSHNLGEIIEFIELESEKTKKIDENAFLCIGENWTQYQLPGLYILTVIYSKFIWFNCWFYQCEYDNVEGKFDTMCMWAPHFSITSHSWLKFDSIYVLLVGSEQKSWWIGIDSLIDLIFIWPAAVI